MALSGVITDAGGTQPMIGVFVFGLNIPNEVLEATIVDKMEDFVMGILMPVYFVVSGLRTNVDVICDGWVVVVVVVVLACSAKVVGTVAVAIFSDLPVREAVAVEFMSNAKSVMALIIIESGQIQGTYSVMMVAVIIITMISTPAAMFFKLVEKHMMIYTS